MASGLAITHCSPNMLMIVPLSSSRLLRFESRVMPDPDSNWRIR